MSLWLAAGTLAFVTAAAIQYAGYRLLLRRGLAGGEPAARREALRRWAAFLVTWQALVLVAVLVYALLLPPSLRRGYGWVAPGLGLVLGTAFPLQLAVSALVRTSVRLPAEAPDTTEHRPDPEAGRHPAG